LRTSLATVRTIHFNLLNQGRKESELISIKKTQDIDNFQDIHAFNYQRIKLGQDQQNSQNFS
jgi:hypothetical protein